MKLSQQKQELNKSDDGRQWVTSLIEAQDFNFPLLDGFTKVDQQPHITLEP